MPIFKRVTIVGLGLIGGSLGMAIRRHRLAREVVGCSRKPSSARRAKQRGAIDVGTTNLQRAVQDADLVVLATPVDTIVPQARRVVRFMRAGSVLTDVGSTKAQIVRMLERTLPRRIAFVGTHPLTGSEQQGIEAARPNLFDGSLCIVTATPKTPRRALKAIIRLWKPLVRRVVVMDPKTHDRLLAAVSHLPHLLAFCLVEAANHRATALAPRSFLDATRVAKSDPDLWDDILLSNRHAILAAMDRFERIWKRARQFLVPADRQHLKQFLRHASFLRRRLEDRS